MSNFLAIATVTATLGRLLHEAISAEQLNAGVSTDRPRVEPESGGGGNGEVGGTTGAINIFLYQVNPNPAWRNADLPTRRSNGDLIQRPQAALDLHYLISFYGQESQLEPQRLLGLTVRTLHSTPILSRGMISATIAAANSEGSTLDFLAASDLDQQIEQVRLTPVTMTLDEFSKLWSIFTQSPYALSVVYTASVLLIEAPEAPKPGLPVRRGAIYAIPWRQPQIETIRPEGPIGTPAVVGSRITILGQSLRAERTRVRVGAVEVEPLAVTDQQLTIALPPNVQAGVQRLQVVHPVMLGDPPEERRGASSNAAALVVQPRIESMSLDGSIVHVRIAPPPAPRQEVHLLLHRESPPVRVSLDALPRGAEGASTLPDVASFDASGVEGATYIVRVEVDGAQSVLETNNQGAFSGPTVMLP